MTAINWTYKSTRDSEIAVFTVGKLKAIVQDCDGDFSAWVIKDGESTLAEGDVHPGAVKQGYHFDAAKDDCAERLVVEAKKRNLYKEEVV